MTIRYALFDIEPSGNLSAINGDGWSGIQSDDGLLLVASKDGLMSHIDKLASIEAANELLPENIAMSFQAQLSYEQARAIVTNSSFRAVAGV